MSEELELKLLREIEELKFKIANLEKIEVNKIDSYSFGKMRDSDLKKLFDINKSIDRAIFKDWFGFNIKISKDIEQFLQDLIDKNEFLISDYSEEDLKMYFLAPILNLVDFRLIDRNIRGFFEEKLTYKTDKFILNGTLDFTVSKGLTFSEKPYFFIQEFKRAEEYSNPRPQLLAEMIAGVELNSWKQIKGAYIVGSIWNFVILEKIEDRYIYYISANFDSSKINDLIDIYKNLMFVKEEILKISEID